MKSPATIVFDPRAVAAACCELRESNSQLEGKQVLGMNAEWETNALGRQQVATIQIAPLNGTPFLFHLQRGKSGFTKKTFPPALKGLLADPNIIKVGVADLSVIAKNMRTSPESCGYMCAVMLLANTEMRVDIFVADTKHICTCLI